MQIRHSGQFRLSVKINDFVFARRNGSSLWELPFARAAEVVAQAVIAEVHGLVGGVVKLHIIGGNRRGSQADGIVGGHDLADDDAGGVVGAVQLVAARLSLGVVGLAGCA